MRRAAPSLAIARLLTLGTACAIACATPPPGASWRAAHPDATRRAPEANAPLGEVLASLSEVEPAVAVHGLRLLAVASDPWREVATEEALLAEAGGEALQAVIAERACRARGWRGARATRASWLLFRGGRLIAYDHWEFDAACLPEHRFRPIPQEGLREVSAMELERALTREVVRRSPESALGPEATFRKGLVYLEYGQVEAAEAMQRVGDRALAEATRRAADTGAPPEAKAALVGARAEATELRRALRRQRGIDEDPSELFWRGE